MPAGPGPSTGSPVRRNARSMASNLMELDTPYKNTEGSPQSSTSTPNTVASPEMSFSGSPGLGEFMTGSPAPSQSSGKGGLLGKSRLAVAELSSPDSPNDSPSALRPIALNRMMEKSFSTSNMSAAPLFGSTRQTMGSRRAAPYKRPTLAPLTSESGIASRLSSTASALPVMECSSVGIAPALEAVETHRLRPMGNVMRRAYSVHAENSSGSPTSKKAGGGNNENLPGQRAVSHFETSEYDGINHIGGRLTPDLGNAQDPHAQTHAQQNSSTGHSGLFGFGEIEMEGKILPCHPVKDDGLLRVSTNTVKALLRGDYQDKISGFHIVDCRFDYEYSGGHIDGAINVNSTNDVERLLLMAGQGVHADGSPLPVPSRSGDTLDVKPKVIIFHCEFSQKRAPAFAKFLRSRDRTINNAYYPKVYFPELYVLEKGYCGFFQSCPDFCQPSAYVSMDDPRHFTRRDSDLHDFRKFTRTRSYTYGDSHSQQIASSASSKSSAPCVPLAFKSARPFIVEEDDSHSNSTMSPCPSTTSSFLDSIRPRAGNGKSKSRLTMTLDSPSPGEDDSDSSPCARGGQLFGAAKPGQPIFGSTKSRPIGGRAALQARVPFGRNASFAGLSRK